MPRYTPLYNLPALAPTDRARDIADISWKNANALDAILAQQGQLPLGDDLVALLRRLTPYSFLATANTDVAVNGTTHIGPRLTYRAAGSTNIGSTAWSAGILTMPVGSDGEYLATVGIRSVPGGQAFLTLNGTDAANRFQFQDGMNATSTGTVTLKAGDRLWPYAYSSENTLSTAAATKFSLRRLVV